MKFVYVLVSSESDYYLEEMLVSMYSLIKYNPKAEIILVLDKKTFESLRGNRRGIHKYVSDYVTVNLPDDFLPIQKSRYLKTSLRQLINGNFLYIDNDKIITGPLIEDVICTSDIGAVFNQHRDDWKVTEHSMIITYNNVTGRNYGLENEIKNLFNGGVIYSKDTKKAHKFFKIWHELWLNDSLHLNFHKDQPSMWKANYLCGNILSPIEGSYNCQIIYPLYSLRYFHDAKIIHYFSSNSANQNIKFKQKDILEYIRNNGIDKKIENDILNFRQNYLNGIRVCMVTDAKSYDAPIVYVAIKISKKAPFVNYFLNYLFNLYHKISISRLKQFY